MLLLGYRRLCKKACEFDLPVVSQIDCDTLFSLSPGNNSVNYKGKLVYNLEIPNITAECPSPNIWTVYLISNYICDRQGNTPGTRGWSRLRDRTLTLQKKRTKISFFRTKIKIT